MVETTSLKSGINLIPTSTSSPQPVQKAMHYGLLVSRYAVGIIGVVAFGLLGYSFFLTSQLVDMNDQIQTDLAYIRSKEQFQNEFIEFKDYAQVLGTTHRALNPKVTIFTKIQAVTPTVVRMTSFTLGKENLRITAVTNVYQAISDYVDKLSASDFVSSVRIVSINRQIGEDEVDNLGISFTLEIVLK